MNIIRIAGLMSAALLTMGSGGVKKASNDGQTTPTASQKIETTLAADQAPLDPSVEAGPAMRSAASDINGQNPTVSPAVDGSNTNGSDDGSTIEIALSDDYIQGRYFTGGGLLGVDQAEGHLGAYFSDNRDLILNVGLMTVPTPFFIDGLTFSAGGRGYLGLLSSPNDDVFAAAPGVEARYALPFAHPMWAVGNLFYAPDILTLGDAEDIIDLDLRYEAEVVANAIGFIGYREFRFDSDEGGDKRAASEIQVGGRFDF